MTFPQHIAVTMATAVLRVATGVRVRDEEGQSEDKRWGEREEKQGRMRVRKVGKSEKREGGGRAVRALRRDGVQCPKSCSLDTESVHERDVPEQACAKPAGKHCSSILEGKR